MNTEAVKVSCQFSCLITLWILPCPSQASSSARQKNLLSLRDYMQRCTSELYWMEQQADERTAYDWSDNNLDYPARKRQYEVNEQLFNHW